MEKFKLDDRVKVIGKNTYGKIAFIGETHFSEGEWFGVILDEPKGRNNGSIDGRHYFKCARNYGIFVRSCQLQKDNLQSESNACSKTKKVRYPNYLGTFTPVKNKTEQMSKTNSKLKANCNTLAAKIHPMNTVIQDLKNSLKCKSEEIICLEKQKKEAADKLKAKKTELQKMYDELKRSIKTENNLKLEMKTMKSDLVLLKRKLCKTEICLQYSENKRNKLDVTVEDLKEITEHAIIEREIAEEKSEQFEHLLKDEADKCKTLKVKLDIMKEEMKLQSINGVPAVHYVKKIKNEKEVLKCALLKLRDLFENLRGHLLNSEKEVEDLKNTEKAMEDTLFRYKEETFELYDIIDSMSNADDIIFEITERNLKSEEKINHLYHTLHDTENLLEVSEETEEALQEIRFACRDTIECLESKLRHMQAALNQKMILIEEREDIIKKYRDLTFTLREKNHNLSEDLQAVTKDRKQVVLTAENLKLKIQREKRNATKDLIEKENMKYDLETTKDELSYWLLFMPDTFFKQGGENSAIQVKLIASKMLKKLTLLMKLSKSICHDDANCIDLKHLALDTEFLTYIYELYGCISVFMKSSDRINPEQFLTLGKYYEGLDKESREIDSYFTFLTTGNFDRQYCVDKIKNIYFFLSQLLHPEFATNDERMVIYLACYLNMIKSNCKCLLAYCMTLENIHTNSLKLKSDIKLLKGKASAFKINAKLIMNIIQNCENERISLNTIVEERIKSDCKSIQEITNCIINKHATLTEEGRFGVNDPKDKGKVALNELICKCITVDTDLHELHEKLSNGEYFVECVPDSVISPIYSWAQSKRQERDEIINKLEYQVSIYNFKNTILRESLQKAKHTINKINLTKKDAGQQTDEQIYCSGDSLVKNNFLWTINNMENTIKYLRQKNSELISASVVHHHEMLRPLKLLPKQKYHHDTHDIFVLQKRLNTLAVKLRSVLMPQIPDITKSFKAIKYEKYLAEKMLFMKDVEDELWNITIDIEKLKRSSSSTWSDTNSFAFKNMSFINT